MPAFFPHPEFLAVNALGVLSFGALAAVAIALRRRPDWHRRLMAGATVALISPAFARLFPMPLLGAWGSPAVTRCLLTYVLAGMLPGP